MNLFKVERKILILCGIYFLLALCSLNARATADSLFLKNFDRGQIPLMIMAAAVMSSVVAVFVTYLCGRFRVYGTLKLAMGGWRPRWPGWWARCLSHPENSLL